MILSVLVLSGCDSKIGEQPPPPKSQEFSGAKCLSSIKPTIKDFIQGDAKNEALENAWDCIGGAVEKFKRYVRGRQGDRYTSQELATFLEDNFLDLKKGEKISTGLQSEFMKVKQLFIGGNDDLTLDEIDKVIGLIKKLREITVNLNPYVKVLTLKWSVSTQSNSESDARFFENANNEIQNAARSLSSLIEKNGRSYKLSDFVNLMEQTAVFYGEEWEFPKTISKYMPIVEKVKKAIAGGDENSIAANEWGRVTLLGSRGYVQFLRYYYFIKLAPETGTGYRLSYLSRTVEDVFSVFQDLLAEKPEGVVSRSEVTELLKTLQVVWPEFKISEKLILELMKVKQLFFGGSVESFATSDFKNARLKVSHIKVLIERFLPYYAIYGREWKPDLYDLDEAKKFFEEAQLVLVSTATEAGGLFEGSYDLKDFANILTEVEALYPPKGESNAEKVKTYLPLIVEVKKVFLGGFDSTLTKENWNIVLGFAARFYADFLYYDYFVAGNSIEKPGTLKDLSVLSNQTLNIFRDLLSSKFESFVSRFEIKNIAQHMVQLGILPKNLKPEALDSFIGLILNNVLATPERRIDGYVPNVLSLSSIEILREQIQIWLDTELFIANLTDGWSPERGIEGTSFVDVLQKTQRQASISTALQTGLRELLLTANTPVPITVDAQGRALISNKISHDYSAKSLRQLNLNRAVAHLLLQSFVSDKARLSGFEGATLNELQEPFNKVLPGLIEAGIMTPKNITFVSSRFREANVFTPHSDGNSLASYAELSDLVGMIWSGVRINTLLKENLIRVCLKNNSEPKYSDVVGLGCLKPVYRGAMASVMVATPEYVNFIKTTSNENWDVYINNVLKAAGYIANKDNMAPLEDVSLVPHVVQYVEMMFARFDKNKDGIISTQDAIRAFPAFKGVLMELAAEQIKKGSLKEENLLDIFTYILRYGKPPESTIEKLQFFFKWKDKQDKWDVAADRVQLAEIMGYIADQVRKAKKTDVLEKILNLELSQGPNVPPSPSRSE
ncbi:MAG: hypothetical protein ACXVCY_03450 [Pseudobdellovibrionaceae bacterium]